MGIATLIAAGRLDDRLIDRALGLLREVDPGARFDAWIDEGDAADLRFAGKVERCALGAERPRRRATSSSRPTSRGSAGCWSPTWIRPIIGQECIDELADFAGLKREVAEITERAMQGKLDFKAALRERVALLSGLDQDAICPLPCRAGGAESRAPAPWSGRCASAGPARCWCRAGSCPSPSRWRSWSASTGSAPTACCSTASSSAAGSQDPIVDGTAKREALIATRDELGLASADVLAVGDGANDRLMIEEAGLGVAFRAKPALAEVADARLDHHGLDALLWAQGIRKQEWVRS